MKMKGMWLSLIVLLQTVGTVTPLDGSVVYLVQRQEDSNVARVVFKSFLTNKTSLVIGCRGERGCVVYFHPLEFLFVVYPDARCRFIVEPRATTIENDCPEISITNPFVYFWFSWDRQKREIRAGNGKVVGTNQLAADTYTSGVIADLSIRGSNGEFSGYSEFLIYPNQQVLALNRREVQFHEIARGTIAIIFGVRGKNATTLVIYKKDVSSPVFRIRYTERSPNIRVFTADTTYVDYILDEGALPELERKEPKFYWMSWSHELNAVSFGEGLVIGANKILTETESYKTTGVDFDSISIDLSTNDELELTFLNPVPKTEVLINGHRSLPDVTSLYNMTDSDPATCVTLTPDPGTTVPNRTNVYMITLDLIVRTKKPVVDVYTPNTNCSDVLILVDDDNYPIQQFGGKFKECVRDFDDSSDDAMCRLHYGVDANIRKINVVSVTRNSGSLEVCEVLVYSEYN